jgi:two-component system cell cycle response regulator
VTYVEECNVIRTKEGSGARATVLVVDDSAPMRKLCSLLLTRAGYAVLEAGNGEQALSIAGEDAVDCVLLDVMLPGMDGYEVCRRIRGDPATARVPVALVTSLTRFSCLYAGSQAGADRVLNKPVEPVELLETVEQLVEGGRAKP